MKKIMLSVVLLLVAGLVYAVVPNPGHGADQIDWSTPIPGLIVSGNVGIGTSTPNQKLHVYEAATGATGRVTIGNAAQGTLFLMGYQDSTSGTGYNDVGSNIYYDGTNWNRYSTSREAWIISQEVKTDNTGGWGVYHANAGANPATSSLTTLLTIKGGGNVGIGTTSPGAKLHVVDTKAVATDPSLIVASSNNPRIHLVGTEANGKTLLIEENAGALRIGESGVAEWVKIVGGKVGIGTSSPVGMLDVNGATRVLATTSLTGATGKGLEFFGGTTGYVQAYDRDNQAFINLITQSLNFEVKTGNPVVDTFWVGSNGNVGIGTTTPGADKLDVRGRAYASGGWQTTDADYAEWFEKEGSTVAGDLIGIDLATGKARRYVAGDKFIGIHSSNAGVVGNRLKETDAEMEKDYVLVGLLGQLDFNKSQTVISKGIVKTHDGAYVGVLLSNKKVLIGR